MNIYLVTRTEEDYDDGDYSSFMAIADSEEEVKLMHPGNDEDEVHYWS